jgi:hypothetical protein
MSSCSGLSPPILTFHMLSSSLDEVFYDIMMLLAKSSKFWPLILETTTVWSGSSSTILTVEGVMLGYPIFGPLDVPFLRSPRVLRFLEVPPADSALGGVCRVSKPLLPDVPWSTSSLSAPSSDYESSFTSSSTCASFGGEVFSDLKLPSPSFPNYMFINWI